MGFQQDFKHFRKEYVEQGENLCLELKWVHYAKIRWKEEERRTKCLSIRDVCLIGKPNSRGVC